MPGTALLTTVLLLLVAGICQGGICGSGKISPFYPDFNGYIRLTAYNSFENTNQTYTTHIAYRGILIGAMRTLKQNNSFKFKTIEDHNYGPFLVSVNGLKRSERDRTYWELLSQSENGTITRPNVGVGCYIPKPNEHIILKFTKY